MKKEKIILIENMNQEVIDGDIYKLEKININDLI